MSRWETMENALKAVDDVAEAWRRDRRELRDEINWLHSELHGAEMEAEKARDEAAENKWARTFLNGVAERIRLANASSLRDYVSGLESVIDVEDWSDGEWRFCPICGRKVVE